jgi:hypothetical protein
MPKVVGWTPLTLSRGDLSLLKACVVLSSKEEVLLLGADVNGVAVTGTVELSKDLAKLTILSEPILPELPVASSDMQWALLSPEIVLGLSADGNQLLQLRTGTPLCCSL